MRYKHGAAFRRALEDRLRTMSLETGEPLVRLRKMVAFDRFLSRLLLHGPDQWVVKGGFALQLRHFIPLHNKSPKNIMLILAHI